MSSFFAEGCKDVHKKCKDFVDKLVGEGKLTPDEACTIQGFVTSMEAQARADGAADGTSSVTALLSKQLGSRGM